MSRRWTRTEPPARPLRLTRRGLILLGGMGAVMGALGLRMRELQVEQADAYRLLAEENRISLRLIPPARGQIFDRQGRPLAVNRRNFRVLLIREQAGEVEAALDRLGRLIPLTERDRERVLREMRRKAAFVPVTVTENLSWEDFARVNANLPALPGVDVEAGLTRHYPEGAALAHVVGYVGRVSERDLERDQGATPLLQIPDFQIGKSGVEGRADLQLRGAAGLRRIEVNARGREVRELSREDGSPGADLQLSVDLGLQAHVMERLAGESAAVVVMDAATGDLVACASSPGFDPNPFVRGISTTAWNALLHDPYRPLADKTVAGLYPPGSTFKMVVALAALEAGVLDPAERIFCNGRHQAGDRWFHCWKRSGHGHVGLRASIAESCDVYYYEVARRVGVDAIAAMSRKLGLGVRHDLPLPAVAEGLAPTREWKRAVHGQGWQLGDTLNVGIGQGYVLASPLQLAVMTARLASGRAVVPRLIRAEGGRPLPDPTPPPLDLSPTYLRLMREGMIAVMEDRGGTARASRIVADEGRMAGKTGTSQVRRITPAERAAGVIRNEDLPWERRDHALYVGYAPYDAPRYAVSVVVEHGGGGSSAAAPIARDVMMRAIWGTEPPPLAAWPPDQRRRIEEERMRPPAARPEGAPPAPQPAEAPAPTGPRRA